MKIPLPPPVFCILAGLLSFTRIYGQADTTNNLYQGFSLKELLNVKVITASKVSQSLEMAPATVIVITQEQIKIRGYQSLLDVMYDLPDVKVDDKVYSSVRNSFTVRGTQGSEKFLIMMDGIIISSPSGEALPVMENYPVHAAEQIEIVYGSASALYGANAVSGVINIITRKLSAGNNILIEASSVAGIYGYTNTTLFAAKKINEHINFTFLGQYAYDKGADYSKLYKGDSLFNINPYATGSFPTIYGPVSPVTAVRNVYEAPNTAYNVYAALHVDDFTFSVFRNYTRTASALGSNTSNTIYNKEIYIDQDVTTATASYKKSFGKIASFTALGVSEYNLQPGSNYRNLYTAMEPAYKYSTCSMVKAEQQIDYKLSGKLSFSGGLSFENYTSVPTSADLAAPVNQREAVGGTYLGTSAYYNPGGLPAQFYFIRYHNTGSYLQTQYSPSEKINFTLGARYDINSRYGNTFNPRLGFVYKPAEGTTIKALYGTSFLAPSPSDSYVQYGSFDTPDSGRTYHSNFLHLPNPGLKPIQSQSAEISLRQYLTKNLSLSLDVYYTALSGLHEFADDALTTKLYNNQYNGTPVDFIEVFINEEKQKNYGGSVQVNWKHSIHHFHFNSFAILSYVNGRVQDPDVATGEARNTELDFIAPVMIRIGTEIKNRKFSIAPRLLIMGSQHIAGIAQTTGGAARRQTIPGYALLNISARYATGEKVDVFTNISNALNQHYRSVGFNMDQHNTNTDIFNGQREDPIRIAGGFHFSF